MEGMTALLKETSRQANINTILNKDVDKMAGKNKTLEEIISEEKDRSPDLAESLQEISDTFKECLAEMKSLLKQQQEGNAAMNLMAKRLIGKCKEFKKLMKNHKDAAKYLQQFEEMLISNASQLGIMVDEEVPAQPRQTLGQNFKLFILFLSTWVVPLANFKGKPIFWCKLCETIFISNSEDRKNNKHIFDNSFFLKEFINSLKPEDVESDEAWKIVFRDFAALYYNVPVQEVDAKLEELRAVPLPHILLPKIMPDRNPKHSCTSSKAIRKYKEEQKRKELEAEEKAKAQQAQATRPIVKKSSSKKPTAKKSAPKSDDQMMSAEEQDFPAEINRFVVGEENMSRQSKLSGAPKQSFSSSNQSLGSQGSLLQRPRELTLENTEKKKFIVLEQSDGTEQVLEAKKLKRVYYTNESPEKRSPRAKTNL